MSSLSKETLELIADWAEILTVVLALASAFCGIVLVIANKPLKKIEAHENEVLRGKVAEAQTELSAQEERTSRAVATVAGLDREVADAKTEMAKQQARAATAEKDLLELRERIKPRILTDKQSADFVAVLSKLPNTYLKLGWTQGGGDESFKFLQQLMPLFKQARWKVPATTNEVSNHLDIQVTGVALLIPGPEGADVRKPEPETLIPLNAAQANLRAAFKAVGIDLQFQRWFHTADGIPELVVGSKPNL